jgi:hypothetical protein
MSGKTENVNGILNLTNMTTKPEIFMNSSLYNYCASGLCVNYTSENNLFNTTSNEIYQMRTGNRTLNFWLYPRVDNEGFYVFYFNGDAPDNRWFLYREQNLSLSFSTEFCNDYSTGFLVPNETLTMITLVNNDTNILIYKNGTYYEKCNVNPVAPLPFGLDIGHRGLASNMKGFMDDIGFWNRTLSNEEILSIYNSNLTYPFPLQYLINSINFNNDTVSGNLEIFSLNVTFDTTYYSSINVYLNYNGTDYLTSSPDTGNTRIFSKTLTIPLISTQMNISLYFKTFLTNQSGSIFNYNTSLYNTFSYELLL